MILRKFLSVSSSAAAAAHRKAISPERQRVTRPVRPSTPESELSMMLVVARHVRSIGNSPRRLLVNPPEADSNPSRRLAAAFGCVRTRHFPFDRYADAYRFIDEHREESMKVFVDVSP